MASAESVLISSRCGRSEKYPGSPYTPRLLRRRGTVLTPPRGRLIADRYTSPVHLNISAGVFETAPTESDDLLSESAFAGRYRYSVCAGRALSKQADPTSRPSRRLDRQYCQIARTPQGVARSSNGLSRGRTTWSPALTGRFERDLVCRSRLMGLSTLALAGSLWCPSFAFQMHP